jgi:hypothetical protein
MWNKDEVMVKATVTGHPGTHNEIKKWSMSHLGGIDITSLGPPAVVHSHLAEEMTKAETDVVIPVDVPDVVEYTTEENI